MRHDAPGVHLVNGTKALVRSWADLRKRQTPTLLATVVRTHGQSCRRPGARMLLTRQQAEAPDLAVLDAVRRNLSDARPTPSLVTTEGTASDELRAGLGLGCGDAVDVLIERLDETVLDPVRFIESCHRLQRRGAIATVFRSDDPSIRAGARLTLAAGGPAASSGLESFAHERLLEHSRSVLASGQTRVIALPVRGGSMDILVEAVRPPPQLFLFGTSRDAALVAALAHTLGWDVLVCEPEARLGTRERFPDVDAILDESEAVIAAKIAASERPVAVVMTHDHAQDRAALELLLPSHARYVGVLGTQERAAKLLAELGVSLDHETRVFAPVGLAIGHESPEETALAIVAQIQSVLSGAHERHRRTQSSERLQAVVA